MGNTPSRSRMENFPLPLWQIGPPHPEMRGLRAGPTWHEHRQLGWKETPPLPLASLLQKPTEPPCQPLLHASVSPTPECQAGPSWMGKPTPFQAAPSRVLSPRGASAPPGPAKQSRAGSFTLPLPPRSPPMGAAILDTKTPPCPEVRAPPGQRAAQGGAGPPTPKPEPLYGGLPRQWAPPSWHRPPMGAAILVPSLIGRGTKGKPRAGSSWGRGSSWALSCLTFHFTLSWEQPSWIPPPPMPGCDSSQSYSKWRQQKCPDEPAACITISKMAAAEPRWPPAQIPG